MWRKEPERHDNPFIFKRSGRKSQVTLCRNSSEPQPGVCGSSCQLCVSVVWIRSSRSGREDAVRVIQPRACATVRATDTENNNCIHFV